MKIALYNPYLTDIAGGGERHFLTIAQYLSRQHQVDIVIPKFKKSDLEKFAVLKKNLSQQFNLNLDKVNFTNGPFGLKTNWRQRLQFTKQYDIFYYMTDGSLFISKAKLNIVHFQIPFNKRPHLWQKLKLKTWQVKTSNSFFTKEYIEKTWRTTIDYVHWGSINSQDFFSLTKKNVILNVGRFFSPKGNKHCKRQDFLVKTFKKMCDQGLKDWRLIFNGPTDKGKDNLKYAKKVVKLAQGYPIIFRHQSLFKALQRDYGQAKIYWHATGYGINQQKNPQAVEHLGLSTIEAMAAGAVPIVIKKGGQPEAVTHAIDGLLWNSQKELISQTRSLIDDNQLLDKLSHRAIIKSKQFSYQKFCRQTKKIFKI